MYPPKVYKITIGCMCEYELNLCEIEQLIKSHKFKYNLNINALQIWHTL